MSDGPLKIALVALNQPGHQSLGLAYVRAYAENHERLRRRVAFQTLELDVGTGAWRVAYRLLKMKPDVIGFSVTCWNAREVYEVCEVVRGADPDVLIVLGGPEVTPQAEHVLSVQSAADVVVRGEGEETFAGLLLALIGSKRVALCPGVTAREDGRIVSAPDRDPIQDLDSLPSPYLTGVLQPSPRSAYIETYRGCPHSCSYCFEAKGVRGIRSFSRERIVAEIDAVASAPGVREVSFVDAVFNLTRERLGWLADVIEPYASRGLRLHTIEVDIERVDDAEAAELLRAGVMSVETGPQSVGEAALATCHRKLDPQRFVVGVDALKRAGILVECDLIIGLPGDEACDVIAGLRWLLELDPGILQSSTLRVLPGTDLALHAEELGLCYDREPDHSVVRTNGIDFADLRRLEMKAAALQEAYRARV